MTDAREIHPPPYRVADGFLRVLQAAINLFGQKPAGSVSAWADAYRILPSKSASESGRWRTSRTPYLKAIMDDLSVESPVQRVVFIKSTQVGAPLALDTPIPTPGGWTTMGAIQPGDFVFDEQGKPTLVLGVSPVMTGRSCNEVVFSDGATLIADDDHRWTVFDWTESDRERVVTTRSMRETLKCDQGRRNRYSIAVTRPLQLPDSALLIDPYALGVWLGDGNNASNQIAIHEDAAEYMAHLPSQAEPLTFYARLVALHLLGNKHIPPMYLRAGYGQRLALLQGLMDTDGHIGRNGRVEWTSVCPKLTEDFIELCTSLSLKPKVRVRKPTLVINGRDVLKPKSYYSVGFLAYADQPVARLHRKYTRQVGMEGRRITETKRRRITAIRPCPSVPVRCIAVASERHLFLAGRAMIPTHNTEAGLNWIGWFIATQRAPMMCVQPTIEMAERFSKQRLTPMIDVTPQLRAIIPPARSRDSGNTTLMKDYPGGMLILSGANSSASLRSMPAKYLFLDEIDAYPLDLDGEGDPVALAEARLSTFSGRTVFLCSTPTIESLSRIQKEWLASNQQRYYVPCPHCGVKNPLSWQHLHWPEHQPESALYECPDCRTPIAEHHKTQMLERGEWRAEHPERSIHGYHINALYTPIGLGLSWPELAAKFERVKKDPAQYKTFLNTVLGECFADPDEKLEADEIQDRAESYALRTVPAGCSLITAGIDVQKDRFALILLGHGRNGVVWVLDYVELPADPTRPQDWAILDDALSQTFHDEKGLEHRITAAAIDSGYLPDEVLYYTRNRRGKIIAVKGASTPGKPIIGRPSKVDFSWKGTVIKAGAEVWIIGHDTAKAQLFARLSGDRKRIPQDRMVHFPNGLDASFYNQLTAEVWDSTKRRWIKIRPRNEALDCFSYAMAAAMQPSLRIHTWKDAQWTKWERSLGIGVDDDLFSAVPVAAPVIVPETAHSIPPPVARHVMQRQTLNRTSITRRSL